MGTGVKLCFCGFIAGEGERERQKAVVSLPLFFFLVAKKKKEREKERGENVIDDHNDEEKNDNSFCHQ